MYNSPYSPGAGHRPPILAGREALIEDWHLALNDVDIAGRRHAPDIILTGPRGIGKTAVISEFADLCGQQGYELIELQATAGSIGLVASLIQQARKALAAGSGPWRRARHAFERIAGVSLTVAGTGGGLTLQPSPPPPPASPEDVGGALAALAREVRVDRTHGGALVTIDEMQVAHGPDLALLAAALQVLNRLHPDAAVLFAGTGLPHIHRALTDAKVTHPDRLFDLRPVPLLLDPRDARFAIVEPARLREVSWSPDAADHIVEVTRGYPAHLQLFAHRVWEAAEGPTITMDDAVRGETTANAEIERRTLAPRIAQAAPRQLEYLAALALHGGETSTAQIATALGRTQRALSVVRDALITNGDVYAPRHGRLALTVPLLGPFLLTGYEADAEPLGAMPLAAICRNAGLGL